MNEKVEVAYTPTPEQAAFWHRKAVQENLKFVDLKSRLNHKMTPKSRSKLQLELLKTQRRIKNYLAYEKGTAIPPSPSMNQENNDMNEVPRLIEIAYGPEPWRLTVNVALIQSLHFIPKFGKTENGETVIEAFLVSINVAGRPFDFPFNRAIDAQSMYEYIKNEIVTVGVTVRTLEPTHIPVAAPPPEPEVDLTAEPYEDPNAEPCDGELEPDYDELFEDGSVDPQAA